MLSSRTHNNKQVGKWLNSYNWSFFCTFTTRYDLSSKSARRLMEKLATFLGKGKSKNPVLFWIAEPYGNKAGYHLHALIKTSMNPKRIWDYWFKRYGRNQVRNYDKGLKGSEYITKYIGNQWTDWDIK